MTTIDVWAQPITQRFAEAPWLATLRRWTASDVGRVHSPTEIVAAMDDGGIDVALLSAWHGPSGSLISNEEVLACIAQAPTRFRGLVAVDLNDPMGAVRTIRHWVRDHGFIGVRVVPWLWDLPPNDRRYYPIYVACVELGVPLCTQIGHTGPLKRSETGRPIPYLEDVLLDFPELVVVAGHVGVPWIDEVITLVHKFPNFYVDTSAYAVHRLPDRLVELMKGSGRTRVMFGTNWPMLSPSRALERIDSMGLDPEGRALFLGGNAARLFRVS